MLKKLSDTIAKVAEGRTIVVVIVIYMIFHIAVMPWAAAKINDQAGGIGLLDLQVRYTPDKAYEMMSFYGEQGRTLYLHTELTADLVFAIVNAVFFSLLITYFFRRAFSFSSPVQLLNLLPFFGMVADFLENIGIVTMLINYPEKLVTVAQATNICTMTKWVSMVATLITIMIGLGALLRKEAKSGSRAA